MLNTRSLATLHREYAALLGLEYYDLLSHILRPQLVRSTKFDEAEVKRTMALYSLNQPQAEAIVGSLQSEDFCLVQGVRRFPVRVVGTERANDDASLQERARRLLYAVS
jgi:hypothetical protein